MKSEMRIKLAKELGAEGRVVQWFKVTYLKNIKEEVISEMTLIVTIKDWNAIPFGSLQKRFQVKATLYTYVPDSFPSEEFATNLFNQYVETKAQAGKLARSLFTKEG